MRNRTEAVTTTMNESEEEEQSVDDSEEDWQPEDDDKKKKGAKGGKRKSSVSTTNRRSSTKRAKKDESESEEEQEEDSEEEESEEEDEDEEEDLSDDGASAKGKKSGGNKKARASISVGKNQPDKDGFMELYLFKNDLTKDFRKDDKLCMWRRDGASLLQKYMVVSEESQGKDIHFKASSVYSCWEEKRKNDFFQIKVQIMGDKKEGKVKVVNIEEFEKFSTEDRPKVDITPKGAEGGADGDDDDEEEDMGEEEAYDEDEEEE